MFWQVVLFATSCLVNLCWNFSYGCNEAVCASIVSKCMLTQSCKCDLKNCTCCKDCFQCLDYLYDECCSCVDLCPKPNDTHRKLSKSSQVEDLKDPVPELFTALTQVPDPHIRWTILTFPVDIAPQLMHAGLHKNVYSLGTNTSKDFITLNCTVVFMTQCMSWNKCKASCNSMGSSGYRWFHDGCCQCVGHTCINYGSSESKCLKCPDDVFGPEDEEIILSDPDQDIVDIPEDKQLKTKDEFVKEIHSNTV